MEARVILDTDIGTDVDDCLALAVLLGSPELRLEGVTCVYGDVRLRARMVLKLLDLRGRADVPVMVGAEKPLLGQRAVYWAGHEGQGLLDAADEARQPADEHAVDFIVHTALAHPGEIHLIAIGPLTNAALALLREPNLPLRHLTIMGGAVRGPDRLDLPYAEHNFRCDPEAAHVVMTSGVSISLVPLDVTTRVEITRDHLARIPTSPFHDAVRRQVELYPRFQGQGATFLHDPLAVATVVDPTLCDWTDAHVDVELQGAHAAGASLCRAPSDTAPRNAAVALGVDATRAAQFVVDRIASL